jgi:hypothetical protein
MADMLEKIGTSSKEAFKGFKNLVSGSKPGALLGAGLEDLLKTATSKSLEAPDATTNQQVAGLDRKSSPIQLARATLGSLRWESMQHTNACHAPIAGGGHHQQRLVGRQGSQGEGESLIT